MTDKDELIEKINHYHGRLNIHIDFCKMLIKEFSDLPGADTTRFKAEMQGYVIALGEFKTLFKEQIQQGEQKP